MAVDASGLRSKVETYGARLSGEAAAELLREVDRDVPVDTGRLRASGSLVRQGARRWRIRYREDHASWTDTGSAPHVIRPRRASVLRFTVGGRTVYARKVNHPGSPGTRWFAGKVSRDGWVRILRRVKGRIRA